MQKTFKREVAVTQLILHWILVLIVCYQSVFSPETNITSLVDLTLGLAIWVYGFAAAAFGLDSLAKQITPARRD